jgi:DNA-binding protein HU-beta
MKKADLINAISTESELSKGLSEKALDALAIVLKKQLLTGEALLIPGIGTFSVIQKAARLGRNPKTGDTVEIPAKKTVKFKATKTLADAVNE